MNKTSSILLFFLALSITAAAEPGFNPISDKSTPSIVSEASKYLYEFWGPGETQQVDQKTYLQLEKKIALMKSPKELRNKMAFVVAIAEIERCKKLNLPTCSISSTPARGTAFLMSGRILATVTHNFSTDSALLKYFGNLRQKWNSELASSEAGVQENAMAQIKQFSQNPLQDSIFFVTDKNQNIIFSSQHDKYSFVRWRSSTSPSAKVENRCDDSNKCIAGDIRFDSYSVDNPPIMMNPATFVNDIALMKIELSKGIPVSDQNCILGQKNYIVGYPAKTQNRTALGFKDASDRSLVYTQGTVVATQDLRQLSDWSGIEGLMQFYSGKNMLFADADGWPGMSGGPILNDQGQVCAVFVGSAPYSGELTLNTASKRFNLFSFGVPLSR